MRFVWILLIALPLCAAQRGLWVVRHLLEEPHKIEPLITYARENHITDIFIQVRALGHVYYKTPFRQPVKNDNQSLRHLLTLAHRSDIKVHAWINAFYVAKMKAGGQQDNHIYKTAHNAIIQRDGQIESGTFIYPGNEENLRQILQIIYDMDQMGMDGIHLDYFRYPKSLVPLSVESRTGFMKRYGTDPARLLRLREGDELNAYERIIKDTYRQFLKEALTQTLREIRNRIRRDLKNKMSLSIAVKPRPELAEIRYLQPWRQWLKENLCDFVAAMNYYPKNADFRETVKQLTKTGLASKIMIGVGVYNIPGDKVKNRIRLVEDSNFAGYVLFSYNYLEKHKIRI